MKLIVIMLLWKCQLILYKIFQDLEKQESYINKRMYSRKFLRIGIKVLLNKDICLSHKRLFIRVFSLMFRKTEAKITR